MIRKNGKFIIKKSVHKYKNKWIEVVEDQVIRPDGRKGIFGIISMKGGTNILPVDKDGYVYLIEEFHYAIGKNGIETSHGGRGEKEGFLAAAKRELKEELGITAKKWKQLGVVEPFTNIMKSQQKLYLAEDLVISENNPDADEDIKIIRVKLGKAVDMVMEGKINYATSCLLILMANEYLKSRK